MIAKVTKIFQRRDPQKEAALALARITTLTDISSLPWESGVYDDRRARNEVHAALGVWMTAVPSGEPTDQISLSDVQQAVCCDLRAEGFGVLTPNAIEGQEFIVAVPNGGEVEDSWKFFLATCCHTTPRPGGWHQLGLRVERVFEPSTIQTREFRSATGDE